MYTYSLLLTLILSIAPQSSEKPELVYLEIVGAKEFVDKTYVVVHCIGQNSYIDEHIINGFLNTNYRFPQVGVVLVSNGNKIAESLVTNWENAIVVDHKQLLFTHEAYKGGSFILKKTGSEFQRIELSLSNAYQERLAMFRAIKRVRLK